MVTRFVTRQLAAAVIGSVLLGGCSFADFVANPVGVGSPAPSKVAGYLAETQSEAVVDVNGRTLTAGEYLIASMSYTNEKCHAFFDTLERFKQDSNLIDKVLTAAAAAGSPLLAATTSSSLAVAKYTGILNFTNLINNNYRDIYTFSDFKEPLQTHVYDLMGDFRVKNGLSTLTRSLVGVSLFETSGSATKVNPIGYGSTTNLNYTYCAGDRSNININIPNPTDAAPTGTIPMTVNSCKVNDFLHSTEPIHVMVARNIASEYASLCSIASMRTIIFQALHVTKTDVGKTDSSSPVTTAVQAP